MIMTLKLVHVASLKMSDAVLQVYFRRVRDSNAGVFHQYGVDRSTLV